MTRNLHHRRGVRLCVASAGLLGALALSLASLSPEAGATAPAAANKYVGAQKCKMCHSAAERGNQYGVWSKMKHAAAWEALATDQAKAYAAERGISEDPQKADACVKCHVTAFGVPADQIDKRFKQEAGVQCEACHGPGGNHVKARMAAAFSDQGGADKGYQAPPPSEINANPTAETCKQCHNEESPSYKPFCFHEFEKQIRHLNPKKPRTPEELAALDECSCEETCVCRKDSPDKKCRDAAPKK